MNGPEFEGVREQLRALAEADAGRGAGPGVETAVLRALREKAVHSRPKRIPVLLRPWTVWAAVGAVAAAFTLIAVRTASEKPGRPAVTPIPVSSADSRPSAPVVVQAQLPKPAVVERAAAPLKARRTAPSRTKQGGTEVATAFYALTPGVDAEAVEGLAAVRVRVPRMTLASFGLPVDMERLHQPVKADLVLGNDGMARAIRFVSSPADQGEQ